MRLLSAGLALAFVCGAALTTGYSQDRKGANPAAPDHQNGTQAPRFDVDRFFKDHDKNNDGKLTKDELPDGASQDFDKIDANKDGSISKDELRQHAQHMAQQRPQVVEVLYYVIDVPEETFSIQELQQAYDVLRKLDKNHDGKIDESDVKAFRQQRREERLNATFKHLDTNHDGKIAKDEARGMWADHFADLDKNRDGFLDRQEVQAAFDMHHQAAAHQGQAQNQAQPPKKQ